MTCRIKGEKVRRQRNAPSRALRARVGIQVPENRGMPSEDAIIAIRNALELYEREWRQTDNINNDIPQEGAAAADVL